MYMIIMKLGEKKNLEVQTVDTAKTSYKSYTIAISNQEAERITGSRRWEEVRPPVKASRSR